MNIEENKSVITKKELMSAFWRSFTMQASWNYEKMMAGGFVYAMIPALKKIYPNKEDLAKALKRHLEIFNTTPQISTFILGLAISMEEENAKNPNFPTASINSVKTSLMGPLAGIGDSFFWGTFRIIACGIGIYLGQKGNLAAPIALLVVYNIPHILAKYYGLVLGYKSGATYLMKAYENKWSNGKNKFYSFSCGIDGSRSYDSNNGRYNYKITIWSRRISNAITRCIQYYFTKYATIISYFRSIKAN